MAWRIAVAVAGAALVAVAAPALARADGDPASDVLYNGKVFVPFYGKLSPTLERQLQQVVADAWKEHFPIKVAVISSRSDLGAVGALWLEPERYSHFLGEELAFLYKGRLLIVMPNGYGLNHGALPTAAERRLLAQVPIGKGLNGQTASAADAVRRLAAAAGHPLPKPIAAKSSASRDRLIIAGVVILLGTLALILVASVRRRLP